MTSMSEDLGEAPDFHDAWVSALVVLEMDVDRAEELLRCHDAELPELLPWSPPTSIGTLPLTLLERARVLHERQIKVAEVLAGAIAGNRGQSAMIDAISATRPDARPVFVDRAC